MLNFNRKQQTYTIMINNETDSYIVRKFFAHPNHVKIEQA